MRGNTDRQKGEKTKYQAHNPETTPRDNPGATNILHLPAQIRMKACLPPKAKCHAVISTKEKSLSLQTDFSLHSK